MAKFKCANCNATFEAQEDVKELVCPECGKKFWNPLLKEEQKSAQALQTAEKGPAPTPLPPAYARGDSVFTGTVLSLIGHRLFNALLLIVTLGFAYPWVVCRSYRWEISHKVIDGYQLTFDGNGGSLLGHWLVWVLLTIVTIGIYGFFVPVKVQSWITERTHIKFVGSAKD